MSLQWVDVLDIGIELAEKFPDIDPTYINFVDLRNMVIELEEFDDDPARCGEKVLEAIQAAWLDERD